MISKYKYDEDLRLPAPVRDHIFSSPKKDIKVGKIILKLGTKYRCDIRGDIIYIDPEYRRNNPQPICGWIITDRKTFIKDFLLLP